MSCVVNTKGKYLKKQLDKVRGCSLIALRGEINTDFTRGPPENGPKRFGGILSPPDWRNKIKRKVTSHPGLVYSKFVEFTYHGL